MIRSFKQYSHQFQCVHQLINNGELNFDSTSPHLWQQEPNSPKLFGGNSTDSLSNPLPPLRYWLSFSFLWVCLYSKPSFYPMLWLPGVSEKLQYLTVSNPSTLFVDRPWSANQSNTPIAFPEYKTIDNLFVYIGPRGPQICGSSSDNDDKDIILTRLWKHDNLLQSWAM